MSAKDSKPSPWSNRLPDRPVGLLERVVAGQPEAWRAFVEAYYGFLYSLAWRYAHGDVDMASELVLVALEGLKKTDSSGHSFYRLRKYLESLEQFGQRSRFVTWLALVSKNLFRDWFRAHLGRRSLPREIEELEPLDQEIFRLVFWDGLLEAEAFSKLSAGSGLLEHEFDRRMARITKRLKGKKLIRIHRELLRRIPALSLTPQTTELGSRLLEVADPRPESRPDLALELVENRAMAAMIGTLLNQAIQALPKTTCQVLMLHALQGLSGEAIAKIMGFQKRQRVYDELAKARRKIGIFLHKAGVDPEQIQRVEGLVDGWFQQKKRKPGIRSSLGYRQDNTRSYKKFEGGGH